MTEDDAGADGEDVALGPVVPTPEAHAEIIDFIRDDQSRLGEVFRGLERGLNADEIASELGVATSGFVWNQSRMIQALTRGKAASSKGRSAPNFPLNIVGPPLRVGRAMALGRH